MYDAIVVGARCAGSPTAMALARKGYRVLLVDRASFPSDVVNGYYLQQHAVARLKRWGLLDKLRNSNCPPLRTLTFDFGDFSLNGSPPPADDVSEGYAPRRIVLDKILVDAAVQAGAELREGFSVEALQWDGDHVTGVRSRTKAGTAVTESARIVIGADGPSSVVARSVDAQSYKVKPSLTCWYFSHWSEVPTEGVEFYLRAQRALIAARTNDGLTVVLVGCPYDKFRRVSNGHRRKLFQNSGSCARIRATSTQWQANRTASPERSTRQISFAGPMVLAGRWSEMPVIIRTLLPRRELRTAFAMPNWLRKQSAKVSPDYAHSPKHSPTMRRRAIWPLCRCTSSRSSLQILPNRPHRRCGNCCTLCAAIRPRPTDSSAHGRARCRFPSSSRQKTSSALSQAN